MAKKIDLYGLCRSNGFSLKELVLVGRLLLVLIKPKIVIKKNLKDERKRRLVSSAISHLLHCSDCRLAIFWRGQKQFFHLQAP